ELLVPASNFLRPLAQFAEQPRVLHRDDRLRGEILQEGNLFIGKGPHYLAVNVKRAKQHAILPQGNAHDCSDIARCDHPTACRIAFSIGILDRIQDVDAILAVHQTAIRGVRTYSSRYILDILSYYWW